MQFAVLDALLDGVYSSGITVAEVLAYGNTGIGCCEGLGGEVVILDGRAYECTVGAPPRMMDADESLPFVDVCRNDDGRGSDLADLDLDGVGARIEAGLVSRNLFHAVRIDGVVARVRTRVTRRQEPPFRPLADVAAEQVETLTSERSGSLVGFWMPRIYQGITVAGLHLHFLSDDRAVGGHVLDLHLRSGRLRLSAYAGFELRLPVDEQFLDRELTHDDDQRIAAVESGPSSNGE